MRTCVKSLRFFWRMVLQILILISMAVGSAGAVDVTLAWDETTASDLAGYKVYYRTCPAGDGCASIGAVGDLGIMTVTLDELADRQAPEYIAKGLPPDSDFVFVVTAYTQGGVESGFSNEALYRAPVLETGAGTASDEQPPAVPAELQGSAMSDSAGIVLTWADSYDNTGVAAYAIYRDGIHIGDTVDTDFTDTDVVVGATYAYAIVAIDTAGNRSALSEPFSVSVPSEQDSEIAVLRVNCGGGRYWDTGGNEWSADSGYNTGRVSSSSVGISDTAEDTLYRSKRWDSESSPEMAYRFKLVNGSYLVKLHFAETWKGAYGSGLRVFDILIEDSLVESRLDIFAEVGANAALVRSYPVTVTDGQLSISFAHRIENPQINAIEVLSVSAGNDLIPPPVPQQLAGVSSADGDTVTLKWAEVTDIGGSGIDGYVIYRDGSQIGYAAEATFVDKTVEAACLYSYEVSAVDKAYNESEVSPMIQVTTESSADSDNRTTLRINAGGAAYTDQQGNRWLADSGYNTGVVSSTSTGIKNTLDDALYRIKRYDKNSSPEMEYSFRIPNGEYVVKLHFAETWKGAFKAGRRQFHINIEGKRVESHLDIFARVGANKALIRSYPITLRDGQLNIRFLHKIENPLINAIEVLPIAN